MKKEIFLVVTLLIVSIISVKAQAFSKNTNVVSAGIGPGSSIAGYTYGSQSPAISLQYERGLWEAGPGVISVGGYLGFKNYKYSYDYSGANYSSKWKYTIIGIRETYHLAQLKIENLDLYGGLMLSYNNVSFSDNSGISHGSYASASGFSAFEAAGIISLRKLVCLVN